MFEYQKSDNVISENYLHCHKEMFTYFKEICMFLLNSIVLITAKFTNLQILEKIPDFA